MARILNVKGEVAFFENSKSLWLRGRYIWVLVPGKCLGAWRSSWGTCWAGADLQLWFQRFTQPYGVGTFFGRRLRRLPSFALEGFCVTPIQAASRKLFPFSQRDR